MPAEQKEMKGEVAALLKAKGSGSGVVGGGSPQPLPPCPLCAPPAPLPNATTAAATEPRHFLVSVLLFWVSSSLGKQSSGLQELELHQHPPDPCLRTRNGVAGRRTSAF